MSMKIYIHVSENVNSKETFCSKTIQFKYFKDLDEIDINEISYFSQKKFIFCIDDKLVQMEINEKFSSILIVTTDFLVNHLKEYSQFYSKNSMYKLLSNVTVLFCGFTDQDFLTELEFKVIVMGGCVCFDESIKNVLRATHIVPYRLIGDRLKRILTEFRSQKKIYTSGWIEFYWNNSFTITSVQDKLNNMYIEEAFRAKYFFNCKICLFGFKNEQLDEILWAIIGNSGSIYQLQYTHLADFIVVPNDFQLKNFSRELESIPKNAHQNIVYYGWLKKSFNENWLANFEDYRVFPSNDDKIEESPIKQCNSPKLISISEKPNKSFSISDKDNSKISHFPELSKFENESSKNISNINRTCINNIQIGPDFLQYGYDSSALSHEKNAEKEMKRSILIKEYLVFIKSKVNLFNNFQELKTKSLSGNVSFSVIFEVFKHIGDFFQILFNILQPLIENYKSDCCLGIEMLSHYGNLKKYFLPYNSQYNKIVDTIKRIDKENNSVKECLHRFTESNKISKIDYFIQVPKRILTDIGTQLKDIINLTSRHHPDFKFFIDVFTKNQIVTTLLNSTENSYIEATNQLLLINCIGNPAIFNKDNSYRTVVDCIQISEDELKLPISLFIFDNSLVICRFKYPSVALKRYETALTKMKCFNEISDSAELSSWPSIQSLCSQSPLSMRSLTRNDSVSSGSSIINRTSKKLEGLQCAKFHKLFTGLSKLNWPEKPKNLYDDIEVYKKSGITCVISNFIDQSIEKQLFFTIQYVDKMKLIKNLKLQIIPRVVKDLSKYKKMKTALPDEFEWTLDLSPGMKWDKFILEEKRNFCCLFAHHYEAEYIEDPIPLESMLSIHSEFEMYNGEDTFKTPHQKKKLKVVNLGKRVSPTASLISSPASTRKIISTGMRRMTRIFKFDSTESKSNKRNTISISQENSSMAVGLDFSSSQTSMNSPIVSSPTDFITQRGQKRKSNTGLERKDKNKK